MARVRNIKPSFFKNEDLAECSAFARLLFAGLWTIADREGRLEDRPKRIKADILPYDTVDGEQLLAELAAKNFIARYEIEGNKYIQILTFTEHQKPHQNEQASVIPAQDGSTTMAPSPSHQGNDNSGSNLNQTSNLSLEEPLRPVPVTAREGSFKKFGGSGQAGSSGFDVRDSFSEKDWDDVGLALRDYAPRWDRAAVFAKYNAFAGADPPKKPVPAFKGWLKKNATWLGREP